MCPVTIVTLCHSFLWRERRDPLCCSVLSVRALSLLSFCAATLRGFSLHEKFVWLRSHTSEMHANCLNTISQNVKSLQDLKGIN